MSNLGGEIQFLEPSRRFLEPSDNSSQKTVFLLLLFFFLLYNLHVRRGILNSWLLEQPLFPSKNHDSRALQAAKRLEIS